MTRPQPFAGRPQDQPTKAELARLRVEYGKDERLAYLGHLEVIATVERCVRRARLPFSIGNGFARRMRLQFSGALPVGASSACEYYDVRLTERVDAEEALALLRAATPPALAPARAAYVPGAAPALEAWLNRSGWEVELVSSPVDAARIERAVGELRARGTLTYLRGEREKTVELASTLVALEAVDLAGGSVLVRVETRSGARASLRPRALVDAALAEAGAGACAAVRVRRVAQRHEEDGRLVEPFSFFASEPRAPLS